MASLDQALFYKIGQLIIGELRNKTEKKFRRKIGYATISLSSFGNRMCAIGNFGKQN
ncbi:MAG: hypothetical protein ACJAT4_001277 [Granulosicoccus sp.]|jgi:hypothetical protein